MASVTDQFAKNFSMSAMGKSSELKSRIFFALAALVVYRIGTYIPLPGVNPVALAAIFKTQSQGILGMFDMFSGGALGRMTIFALNIAPYISASIIMQLLTSIVPAIEALKKDGEAGRKKISQYTRYLTLLLAIVQSYGIAVSLIGATSPVGPVVVLSKSFFIITTVSTLTAGTLFLMWLGEQITNRGIGNGVSLIIFSGIVANLPVALVRLLELGRNGALSTFFIIIFLALAIAVVAFIVFIERAQRKILVTYPKRMVGNKQFGGDTSHMPLKLNTAGVIPPIFASSILLLPLTILGFLQNTGPDWLQTIATSLGRGHIAYIITYVTLIVFFAFFYTAVVFNPEETAENLRKQGGFITGIRPGKNTADYFDYILTRLTCIGAAYLAVVCVLPEILISQYSVPFYFGGTSLLIVVSVTMDTVTQIQGHLFAHQYEKLIKKSKLTQKR